MSDEFETEVVIETRNANAETPEEDGSYASIFVKDWKGTDIACVVNGERISKKDGKLLPPDISLPGGGKERNETTLDALYRELGEEFRLPMAAFTGLYPFPPDGSCADITRKGRKLFLHKHQMARKALEKIIEDYRVSDNPEILGFVLVSLSKFLEQHPRIEYPRGSGIQIPVRSSHVRLVQAAFPSQENDGEITEDAEPRWDGKVPQRPAFRERGWTSRADAKDHRHKRRIGKRLG